MHGETDTNILALGENGPLLLTLDETAAILGGITVREVHKRILAGDIEKVKIGRRTFVPRESITTYVARLRREAAEDRKVAAASASKRVA